MSQHYESVRLGSRFSEDSLILDDYGRNVRVELFLRSDVIYLFDWETKALLKEILIMRDFCISEGSAPRTIVLRDQTKEIVLQADTDESRMKCLERIRQVAELALPQGKKSPPPESDQIYHAEPITVVFRHTDKKAKGPPPPIAAKPSYLTSGGGSTRSTRTTAGRSRKDLLPTVGTVRSISRNLEKVLFTSHTFSPTPYRKLSQYNTYAIEAPFGGARKEEDSMNDDEKTYEALGTSVWACAPRTTTSPKSGRVPSDPHMDEEAPQPLPNQVADAKVPLPLPVRTDHASDDDFDSDWEEEPYEIHTTPYLASLPEETIREPLQKRFSDLKITDDDPDMYATNVEIRRPWLMYGHPTRQEAVKFLKGKSDGSFVVRNREGSDAESFPYALTVLYKDEPIHIQIQRTQSSALVLAPWKAGEKAFETLDDLVQYYRDNRLGFSYKNIHGFVSLQKENFGYE